MFHSFDEKLIAPCGINCSICRGFLRDKNKCPGCRSYDKNKKYSCVFCKIKDCNELKINNLKFCFDCYRFPCVRMKNLDKRYRTNYNLSIIENLDLIKKFGIDIFLDSEKKHWTCEKCGGTICVHGSFCISCGDKRSLNK